MLPRFAKWSTAPRKEPMSGPKPFEISKEMVAEAYRRVKANRGAAGIDGETIEEYERDLEGNLYQALESDVLGELLPATSADG